jgi:hypothetical protein
MLFGAALALDGYDFDDDDFDDDDDDDDDEERLFKSCGGKVGSCEGQGGLVVWKRGRRNRASGAWRTGGGLCVQALFNNKIYQRGHRQASMTSKSSSPPSSVSSSQLKKGCFLEPTESGTDRIEQEQKVSNFDTMCRYDTPVLISL